MLATSIVIFLVSYSNLVLLVAESRYFFALPDVEVDEKVSERRFGTEDLVQRVDPFFLPFGERSVFGFDVLNSRWSSAISLSLAAPSPGLLESAMTQIMPLR